MTKVSDIKSSVDKQLKTVIVEDELGRKLEICRPSYMKSLRLLQAVGGTLGSNEAYMRQIQFLPWLKTVDGVVRPLNTLMEMEALVESLDHEGMYALIKGACDLMGINLEATEEEMKALVASKEKNEILAAKK